METQNDIKVETKITIDIRGNGIELTLDQARSLYDQLAKLFEKDKQYIPMPYPYPNVPDPLVPNDPYKPVNPWDQQNPWRWPNTPDGTGPYNPNMLPKITCTVGG